MNYQELTGQESGIWIYTTNGKYQAIVCNWGSSRCNHCMPMLFCNELVWLPIKDKSEWRKTEENVDLYDYLDDTEVLYDENLDLTQLDSETITGDVYENDSYIILAPKGWN